LRLARLVVDDGWPVARAAELFQVSWPTAKRWTERYRELGPAAMTDRSSRPQHQPKRTPVRVVRMIDGHRESAGLCASNLRVPWPGAAAAPLGASQLVVNHSGGLIS
jgi:hypothetical protein